MTDLNVPEQLYMVVGHRGTHTSINREKHKSPSYQIMAQNHGLTEYYDQRLENAPSVGMSGHQHGRHLSWSDPGYDLPEDQQQAIIDSTTLSFLDTLQRKVMPCSTRFDSSISHLILHGASQNILTPAP